MASSDRASLVMKIVQRWTLTLAGAGVIGLFSQACRAASLEYLGTQHDIGGTFYPSGTPPCCVVPWHSTSENNTFAVSNESPNQYYGTAGYALFATQFEYPIFNAGHNGPVSDPLFTDYFEDILDLPDFVTDSQILSTRKAGGWAYALIDDPRLQEGIRLWTFDGTNYPPPMGPCPGENCNVTGGIPYVKLGILNGNDVFGNNPGTAPAARWGFEVGNDVPQKFRVGVMTGGLDNSSNVPNEVFLLQPALGDYNENGTVDAADYVVWRKNEGTSNLLPNDPHGGTIGQDQYDTWLAHFGDSSATARTGVLVDAASNNRFVDMHFFDITDAQPGQQFIIAATKDPSSVFTAGIAGFTFDVVDVGAAASSATPEPSTWLMLAFGGLVSFARSRRIARVS